MNYIIVGTRPQFVKLYGFLKEEPGEYYIIHTGQHYDYEMSKIFFDGLNIPSPDINLDVKGSFPNQVTEIMNSLSQFDITEKDNVIVFGDCSSTLAGALYAKMKGAHLIHVESGYRGDTIVYPEDIIRKLVDHLSDELICYHMYAEQNLVREGIFKSIKIRRNYMDIALEDILRQVGNVKYGNGKILLTIHRQHNLTHGRLSKLFKVLSELNKTIVFPCHPRTKKVIKEFNLKIPENFNIIEPQGYKDFISAMVYSEYVITDSGGIQEEAYFLKKKCIVLNDSTGLLHTIGVSGTIIGDKFERIKEIINEGS